MTRRPYPPNTEKWFHLWWGWMIGLAYLSFIKNEYPEVFEDMNLGCYILMVVWGSSGWFWFRPLRIPILSSIWLYMAIPDWDILLYRLTKDKIFLHRSFFYHSVLPSTLLFLLSRWGLQNHPSEIAIVFWKLLRDLSAYLNVGVSAHLIQDFIQSTVSAKRGFRFYAIPWFSSVFLFLVNLYIGLFWTLGHLVDLSRSM